MDYEYVGGRKSVGEFSQSKSIFKNKKIVSLGSFWQFSNTTHCIFAFFKNWPTLLYKPKDAPHRMNSIIFWWKNIHPSRKCEEQVKRYKICCVQNIITGHKEIFKFLGKRYFNFIWTNWKREKSLSLCLILKICVVYI